MLVAFAIRVSAGEPLLGLPRLLPLPQDASWHELEHSLLLT